MCDLARTVQSTDTKKGRPSDLPFSSPNLVRSLALGVLEATPRALLAVFLALVGARVARQQSRFLQGAPKVSIKLDQCAGNPQADSPGLSRNSPAIRQDHNIETILHFDPLDRLLHRQAARFGRKIVLKRAAVDDDFSRARPQEHSRDAGFAPTGSQILLDLS